MNATQLLASNACTALGYTGAPIAGSDYTDADVAEVAARAMIRQRANFPIVCGASPRESKRRNRRLGDAAMQDAKRILGIGLIAIVMGVFFGPASAIVAILGGVIGWLISNELDDRYGAMFSAAASESIQG